ncbi:hypothetical protein [Azospirillum sp. sgz302134]
MRRMVKAGALALAVLGVAGCSDTSNWFGPETDTRAGTASAVPPGTTGSTVNEPDANATGTSMVPSTSGTSATKRGTRGAGTAGNSGERDRAFYPGTLSGEGMWRNETDAPGAN